MRQKRHIPLKPISKVESREEVKIQSANLFYKIIESDPNVQGLFGKFCDNATKT